MSALSIQVPFPVFQDRDGQPLDNGYVWLGTSSLNPQTNPVVAYYDSALTIVATQPLRTLNGFISRAGSPAQVYVDAVNFSILVQDSKGTTVFSVPEGTGISPNASGVVYDPAGTGAVATTVQGKLRESVSVKDFGAVGDGSTNDTAAIQAAVDASRQVFFPAGTYLISSTINVPTNTSLFGNSRGDTTIKTSSSIAMLTLPTTGYNIRIKHIQIDGNSSATRGISSTATAEGNTAHLILDDIGVFNCTDKNIYLKYMSYATLRDVYCANVAANASAYCLYMDYSSNNDFFGGLFYNGKAGSIHMLNCSLNRLYGVRLYNDAAVTSTQLMLIDSSYSNTFEQCYFEPQGTANVTYNVSLVGTTGPKSCSDNIFRDCSFVGITDTSTNVISIDAYKTILDGCKFIKPVGSSIRLGAQQYTAILNCCDLITYDTPTYSIVTVANTGGNAYSISEQTNLVNTITGSWTPALVCGTSGTITLTSPSNSMSYTKTGDRVSFSGNINVSSVSAPVGELTLTGLPYAVAGGGGSASALSISGYGLLTTSAHTCVQAFANNSSSTIYIRGYNSGSQVTTFSNNIQAGSGFYVSGTYKTA